MTPQDTAQVKSYFKKIWTEFNLLSCCHWPPYSQRWPVWFSIAIDLLCNLKGNTGITLFHNVKAVNIIRVSADYPSCSQLQYNEHIYQIKRTLSWNILYPRKFGQVIEQERKHTEDLVNRVLTGPRPFIMVVERAVASSLKLTFVR